MHVHRARADDEVVRRSRGSCGRPRAARSTASSRVVRPNGRGPAPSPQAGCPPVARAARPPSRSGSAPSADRRRVRAPQGRLGPGAVADGEPRLGLAQPRVGGLVGRAHLVEAARGLRPQLRARLAVDARQLALSQEVVRDRLGRGPFAGGQSRTRTTAACPGRSGAPRSSSAAAARRRAPPGAARRRCRPRRAGRARAARARTAGRPVWIRSRVRRTIARAASGSPTQQRQLGAPAVRLHDAVAARRWRPGAAPPCARARSPPRSGPAGPRARSGSRARRAGRGRRARSGAGGAPAARARRPTVPAAARSRRCRCRRRARTRARGRSAGCPRGRPRTRPGPPRPGRASSARRRAGPTERLSSCPSPTSIAIRFAASRWASPRVGVAAVGQRAAELAVRPALLGARAGLPRDGERRLRASQASPSAAGRRSGGR